MVKIPIKLDPNILQIIKMNEIYNKILSQSNTKACLCKDTNMLHTYKLIIKYTKAIYNEYEIWNAMNHGCNNKYDVIYLDLI